MRRFLEEAVRLLSLRSVTGDGNESVANFMADAMRARGLKTQLQQVSHSFEGLSKRQFNVIGVSGDPLVDRKTRKGLLLTSHVDTPEPGRPEAWTETGGDPYRVQVKDGRIYGVGAASAKLDLLCKLYAMDRFKERKLRMPIYLVGTCGNNFGMFGARYLIKSMALNPSYVMVGEPTGLALMGSHKSLDVFRVSIGYTRFSRDARGFNRQVFLEASGRVAHGARPDEGINAILRLMELVRSAQDAGFEFRMTEFFGGCSPTQVPDRARTQLFLTSHQLEDFRNYFEQYRAQAGGNGAFSAELGGLGETGVQFFPQAVFLAMCDVVASFGELSAELATLSHPSFDPATATINFGMITERPGFIDLHFDLRQLPDGRPQQLEDRLREMIRGLSSQYPGLNMSVSRERSNPSLSTPSGSSFARLCRDALADCELSVESSSRGGAISSEAAHFSAAGYDALVFGPGDPSLNAKSPNEHVRLEHLEQAVAFYEKLIERVCS